MVYTDDVMMVGILIAFLLGVTNFAYYFVFGRSENNNRSSIAYEQTIRQSFSILIVCVILVLHAHGGTFFLNKPH